MKKISLYIFFIVCSCFIFLGSVKADEKSCAYIPSGEVSYQNQKYTFRQINFTVNSGQVSGASVRGYVGPHISSGVTKNSIYKTVLSNYSIAAAANLIMPGVGLVSAPTINAATSYGKINYKKESTGNISPSLVGSGTKKANTWYYVTSDGKQSMSVPNSNLSSCPDYVILTGSDYKYSVNYNSLDYHFQMILTSDESLKSQIMSTVKSQKDYNFAIVGKRYESQAEDADPNGDEDVDMDSCDGMFGTVDSDGNYTEGTTGYLMQEIFNYMKIAAIVSVFVFSVVDYAKALVQQDDQAFKKANSGTVKRIIYGVVFFLLPIIVNLILKIIDTTTCSIN